MLIENDECNSPAHNKELSLFILNKITMFTLLCVNLTLYLRNLILKNLGKYYSIL